MAQGNSQVCGPQTSARSLTLPVSVRGTISRGDLLRSLRDAAETDKTRLAGLLGFREKASTHSEEPEKTDHAKESRIETPSPPPPSPKPPPESKSESATYLIPVEASAKEMPPPPPPPGPVFSPDELKAKERPPIKKPPLIRWSRLWPYLRQALGCYRNSGRLDAKALTRLVATLRPIRRVPRLQRLTWAPRATVLLDHRSALTPFWDDMEGVVNRLERWRPFGGLQIETWTQGLPTDLPSRQELMSTLQSMRGCPLLVLSDLGCLEKNNAPLIDGWVSVGHRVEQYGRPASALLPCPRDRWDIRLASIWRCSAWDRSERPRANGQSPIHREGDQPVASGVDALLDLLSPALFSDPILLRQLRLLLGADQADVGTEFDVWFHDSQADRRGLAMALTPSAGIERREKLARSPEAYALIDQARQLIQESHRYCSPSVRIKELLQLAQCRAAISDEEVKQALADQEKLAETALQSVVHLSPDEIRDQGLVDYFRRDALRTAPEQFTTQSGVSVGYGVYRYFSGSPVAKLPNGIDEKRVQETWDRIVRDPGKDSLWELRQEGNFFRLRRWSPPRDQKQGHGVQVSAPVAWLWARRPVFTVDVTIPTDKSDKSIRYGIVLKNGQTEARFEGNGATALTIGSDRASLNLKVDKRPEWATRFGKDQFGQFAEFEVNGVRFPLRWIPPGSFWMGSPEDEIGRINREGPRHQVTITQGFWLATTPCISAQWRALMGGVASPDESELHPVTNVSWKECQNFLSRLTAKIPDLEFFLPTEAEWEYACRAGTESAFNDGSACTNPDGTDPMLTKLGWHGEGFEGSLHPVGQLARNAWGLYDMHGNVWEWCQDGQRAYTQEAQRDPRGPVDPKAGRVLRGGSYWNDAGNCRSACRDESDPVDRSLDIGFRLAAGQPGRSAALAPESGAKGRSPTGGAGRGAKAVGGPERPRWAISRWGQDQWGRLAEFELDGATFRFRWVAPGTFLMGSPDTEQGRDGDEKQHSVTLTRGFWLGDTPCTQEQWEAVMKNNPSNFPNLLSPVERVSWNDCQDFCRRLAKQIPELHPRLPSEAEWEYACRAGTTKAFNDDSDCTQPKGIDPALDSLGWYTKNSGNKTHAMREKRPNAWGLYDMHGNILEWCHDGRRTFSDQAVTDPLGSTEAKACRVLRGGSCWSDARFCRSACRYGSDPGTRRDFIGFRLAAGQPVWSVAPDPESGAKGRSPTGGAERGAPDRLRATR